MDDDTGGLVVGEVPTDDPLDRGGLLTHRDEGLEGSVDHVAVRPRSCELLGHVEHGLVEVDGRDRHDASSCPDHNYTSRCISLEARSAGWHRASSPFIAVLGTQPMRMSFLLTNSSAPKGPSSRPNPLALTPPNGSSGLSAPTMFT